MVVAVAEDHQTIPIQGRMGTEIRAGPKIGSPGDRADMDRAAHPEEVEDHLAEIQTAHPHQQVVEATT